jgi:transposase
MARPASRVKCSEAEKAKLASIANSRKKASGLVLRAKIILACLEGASVKEAAGSCGVTSATVIRWKKRFMERGMEGLSDRRRSGRPPVYRKDFKEAVLAKLEGPPPEGFGQWDGALLAAELGCSKHAVWRFLRQNRISLARKRSWCVSTDPEFVPKAADVVGLYLSNNEKAIVVCIDEKPNIQALEFRKGYAVSSDRKLVQGIESKYKRNGTVNLFAALEVATGRIHGKVTEPSRKTKKGFLEFLEGVLADLPEADEFHVIMDNHSIHKNHGAWLEEHRNVFFHYTPTSASWMNMVEIWLGILSRKSLRGASFSSTKELAVHIEKYTETYNATAKPFTWRKRDVRGTQLANNARTFCN